MPTWSLLPRPQPGPATTAPTPGTPTFYLLVGATLGISAYLLTTTLFTLTTTTLVNPKRPQSQPPLNPTDTIPNTIPSPLLTHLPHLTPVQIASLPYPPDILPGGRSVPTPYGSIRVYEWGPPDAADKVLLIHGISTPCVALGALAHELVERGGCRVMVFDLFGRGYSDTPQGAGVEHDGRLYTTQILMVLASSPLAWTGDEGFHLVGYSFGGGLAVGFGRFFARMVRSVVVVAGSGLIRGGRHVGWRSRVLYSRGWLPEGVVRWFVRRRLMPKSGKGKGKGKGTGDGKGGRVVTETTMAAEVVDITRGPDDDDDGDDEGGEKLAGRHENSDASGGQSFDNAVLFPGRPQLTVSSVMEWQLRNHQGFIPAFVSSIRYAPIYDQQEDWLALGKMLAERRERPDTPGLRGGKLLLVLGASDPVIVKEELLHDATAVLGEDGFEAVVLDAGHELVMTKSEEVAAVLVNFWGKLRVEVHSEGDL
ncbi:Alpha/Beta hydrolase protein [Chaetomium sp. MPI-SDFR-AT-0129]|nr:Alpha/Beta hydrolase protein [Chaetomium sp. MPI-SDFR-AT-0129]